MTLREEIIFRKLEYVHKAIQNKCQNIDGVVDANVYEVINEELEKYLKRGTISSYYFSERWGSFYIEYPT